MNKGSGEAIWALGLMSGTSLDGIDAALVRTDGRRIEGFGAAATFPYADGVRDGLRRLLGRVPGDAPEDRQAIADMSRAHVAAVIALLEIAKRPASEIGIIGFHGHTVLHEPQAGRTVQVGDAALIAAETGIRVVADLRAADVAAGGEGAPFAPLYHRALAVGLEKPLAVLNMGGVGNVTWISPDDAVIAFDTGPANAPLDDWISRHTGRAMDEGGRLARAGRVDEDRLATMLDNAYFDRPPPKSLDRDDFRADAVDGLTLEDGAATLTAFSASAVACQVALLPEPPARWLVTGGGRHNPVLMAELRRRITAPVEPVEAVGWHGDALEAQAFGFLAVRSLRGLPLSLPSTTGVAEPTSGGVLFEP